MIRAWLLCSKVLLWQLTFLIDWRHKRLKNKIDILLFYEVHFMDSREVIYENVEKNIHFTTEISIYTGHRHFEV